MCRRIQQVFRTAFAILRRRATKSLWTKCRSGGDHWNYCTALYLTTQNLKLPSPTPETNGKLLKQQAGSKKQIVRVRA